MSYKGGGGSHNSRGNYQHQKDNRYRGDPYWQYQNQQHPSWNTQTAYHNQQSDNNFGQRGYGFGSPNKGRQDGPAYEQTGQFSSPVDGDRSAGNRSGWEADQSDSYDDSYGAQSGPHTSNSSNEQSSSISYMEQVNTEFKTPERGNSFDRSPYMRHSTPYGHGNTPGMAIGRGRGVLGNAKGRHSSPRGYQDDARSRQGQKEGGGRDRSSSRGRSSNQHRQPSNERRRDHSGSRYTPQGPTWSDDSFSPNKYGRRWDDDPTVFLSKTLSSILRHNAERFNLKLMKGGFLYVDEILYKIHKLRGYTIQDVIDVVQSNDKQRFSLEYEKERAKIRANQGHTLEVDDLDLKPITNPDDFPFVIHGTYFDAWNSIKVSGLNRMKRNHIHFAPGLPGANGVISGMRSSCEVLIYLDLEKALKDGLQFFLSSNNVILSPGDKEGLIHPKYFIGAKSRQGHRLDFDPTVGIKPGNQGKEEGGTGKRKKGKKSGGKKKQEQQDSSQSSSLSTDESVGPPAKIQALGQSSEEPSSKGHTEKDKHQLPKASPELVDTEPVDTGVLKKLGDDYGEDNLPVEESINTGTTDIPDSAEFEETIEVTDISDPVISRCTIEDVIISVPKFVVVICSGKNLGKEDSCIEEMAVGANSSLYVFSLKNKAVMTEGQLSHLLLHKEITKVFCRISEVSLSLINEYDILLNSVPIWDLEVLYKELPDQMSGPDKDMLEKLDFQESMFGEWAKHSQQSGASKDDLKQQAVMMYKLYELFQKSNQGSVAKKMKKEIYERGIPSNEDHFLAEKIEALKLEQKNKTKKENWENNQSQGGQTGKGGKNSGKGASGGGFSKKKKKGK